jgi:hypothetical protein
MGHWRTLTSGSGMSALPSKADIFTFKTNVRFVPRAAILNIVTDVR